MKAVKAIWGFICGLGVIVGLMTGIPTLCERYGVDVGPFFGWFTTNSALLLPLSCFFIGLAAGILIGWSVRNAQAKKEREEVEKTLGMTLEEAAEQLDKDKRKEREEQRAKAETMQSDLQKLNGFSARQLQYMLDCLYQERIGAPGLITKPDNAIARSLFDEGVFGTQYGNNVDLFMLTPEWRIFVTEHENDILAMLGEETRVGALPNDEVLEMHLPYLQMKA